MDICGAAMDETKREANSKIVRGALSGLKSALTGCKI